MDEALRAKILDVLKSQHLMALATVRPDGYPAGNHGQLHP